MFIIAPETPFSRHFCATASLSLCLFLCLCRLLCVRPMSPAYVIDHQYDACMGVAGEWLTGASCGSGTRQLDKRCPGPPLDLFRGTECLLGCDIKENRLVL